jgi:hypothetical protein
MADTFGKAPKFQWSYFLDHSRNEQIVIRTDDETEFTTLRDKYKAQQPLIDQDPPWMKEGAGATPSTPVAYAPPRQKNGPGNCPKCNAPMKQSMKGNWYCSKLCWQK